MKVHEFMKIQAIKSQTNFGTKNFRLNQCKMEFTDFSTGLTFYKDLYWAKEFSNPRAEELYNKAKSTKDWKEKIKLLSEMGHYKMLIYGTGLIGFVRMLLDKPKQFI